MTTDKKAVRTFVQKYKNVPDQELYTLLKGRTTESEFLAIGRILKSRGLTPPKDHGEVVEDPTEQRVISLSEIEHIDAVADRRKVGMGALEGICCAVGIIVTLVLWHDSAWIALGYGVVIAVVLYAVLAYARNTWRELGLRRDWGKEGGRESQDKKGKDKLP